MRSYSVILVDEELAIKWEDETRAEAIERARTTEKYPSGQAERRTPRDSRTIRHEHREQVVEDG